MRGVPCRVCGCIIYGRVDEHNRGRRHIYLVSRRQNIPGQPTQRSHRNDRRPNNGPTATPTRQSEGNPPPVYDGLTIEVTPFHDVVVGGNTALANVKFIVTASDQHAFTNYRLTVRLHPVIQNVLFYADATQFVRLPHIIAGQQFECVMRADTTINDVGAHTLSVGCGAIRSAVITVVLVSSVGVRDQMEFIKPTRPFDPRQVWQRRPLVSLEDVDLLRGQKPFGKNDYEVKLEMYPCPVSLPAMLSRLPAQSPLTVATYSKRWSILIHLENMHLNQEVCAYDRQSALQRTRDGQYYQLDVEGLAENRPSVQFGDDVHISLTSFDQRPTPPIRPKIYVGSVHRVEQERLSLKFHHAFDSIFVAGRLFFIRFTIGRTTYRRIHRAIRWIQDQPVGHIENLFFPLRRPTLSSAAQLVGGDLRITSRPPLNEFQIEAVKNILIGTHHRHPFIVWGPPGTGKSTVMCESVFQTFQRSRTTRMLVCAPSNAAADILCERIGLKGVDPIDMERINALSRDVRTLSDTVLRYSRVDRPNNQVFPPTIAIASKRIVVSTLMTATILYSIGIAADHFTHIFIDESGHATEPETTVALAGLITPQTRIILSGDHRQLGPIIHSSNAANEGLGVSFMERLMNLRGSPYEANNEGHYNPSFIVKLLHNYRSHPSILAVPNELFYSNELIASADRIVRESLLPWTGWNGRLTGPVNAATAALPRVPVLFVGVSGKEEREASSPSWFNAFEATEVVKYVKDLLVQQRRFGLSAADIGIITPYLKQVRKIRLLMNRELRLTEATAPKVGTVEEFQGAERKVIIISTVRSQVSSLAFDEKYKLGFVSNEKRMNVALTRAKAALIVIGSPHVLQIDQNWNRFLQFCCREHASYTGVDYQWSPWQLPAAHVDSDSDAGADADEANGINPDAAFGNHE